MTADDFDIKEKYERTAVEYARKESTVYYLEIYKKAAREYLDSGLFGTVIDIGCGSGALIRELAPKYPKVKFLGIDFSENLIEIAGKLCASANAEFIAADFIKSWKGLAGKYAGKCGILFLVIGPMAYYEAKDDFCRAVLEAWNASGDAGIVVTFHNRDLIGRRFLSKGTKRYWKHVEARQLFCGPGCDAKVTFFSFVLNDFLAPRAAVLNKLYILADRMLSALPPAVAKGITADFMISAIKLKDSKH